MIISYSRDRANALGGSQLMILQEQPEAMLA
jgi:hypothetical protein